MIEELVTGIDSFVRDWILSQRVRRRIEVMNNNDLSLEDVVSLELNRDAIYFGLEVEVVIAMSYCCSIRYRNQDFIVLTEDLQSLGPRRCAAAA